MVIKNSALFVCICFILCSFTYNKTSKFNDFSSFLKEENANDMDILFYRQDIFDNSFKTFLMAFYNDKNIDNSPCYFELKNDPIKNSETFLKNFNNIVESAIEAKTKIFVMEIQNDEECKYKQDGSSFENALKKEKQYAKDKFIIARNYFINLINTDFWIGLLKFQFCWRTEQNNKKGEQHSVILALEKYPIYHKLFDSFCSIQNLFYHFSKKIDNKTVGDPFTFAGKTLRNFYNSVQPHLEYLEKNIK